MTIDDATLPRVRSIDEVVADLTAELQDLRPTDRRRLKLATTITVLEDRIASQGGAQRGIDLMQVPPASSLNSRGIVSAHTRRFPYRVRPLATALNVLLRLVPTRP